MQNLLSRVFEKATVSFLTQQLVEGHGVVFPNGGPEVREEGGVDDAKLEVVPSPLDDAAVVGK